MCLLTKKEEKSLKEQTLCHICKAYAKKKTTKLLSLHWQIKKGCPIICKLRYKTSNENLVMFHKGSKYHYCFISKTFTQSLKTSLNVSGGNA